MSQAVKLLVLIIASDDLKVYQDLQELWKLQMKERPCDYLDWYFIKCDPNLSECVQVKDNTFFVKSEEDLCYGITYKTIKALEYFLGSNYDYVLRTNLSSFYRFDKLYNILVNAPRSNYYAGIHGGNFVSGCGFVMSKDIVSSIVENQDKIWDPVIKHDDVCFGIYIFSRFPSSYHHIARYDILDQPEDFTVPLNYIHFRIKYEYDREIKDVNARKKLLQIFYNLSYIPDQRSV
jgi:hypothetical protein